ncbi:MAG: flagellar basal body rod protein FlgB [Ignavibacteriales bacterium]|nr:MAG: flagellar basal body rod protein FlgB [Ignavibacteriales bacterium]
MSTSNISLLEKFIGYCSDKNKIISQNIANVGTENYKRQDVVFKDILNENMNPQIKLTNPKHFEGITPVSSPEIIDDNNKDMVSGINNVDIEKEMTDLAQNSINFKFASRKISDHFKGLQNVIKGGGRF